ncbi:hypothetical protein PG989_005570 [Apiospora arundinis]
MTNLYHKVGQLDPERKCPITLVHILVRAACRDPVIALDLDNAIQSQYRLGPNGLPNSQPAQTCRPMAPTQMNTPHNAQGTGFAAQMAFATPNMPVAAAAPSVPATATESPAVARAPTAPMSSTAGPRGFSSAGQVVPAFTAGQKRSGDPLFSPQPPARRIRIEAPVQSAAEARLGSESPLFMPQDESPSSPGADDRLTFDKEARDPEWRRFGTLRPESDQSSFENSEDEEVLEAQMPEPHEKRACYGQFVEEIANDLDWHAKYESGTDGKDEDGKDALIVSLHVANRMKKLARAMDEHRSYDNRLHVLTVMRDILFCCLKKATGSWVGFEVRNSSCCYDSDFVAAVWLMTPGQRRKVRVQGGGAWIERLLVVMREARRHSVYPQLYQALVLLDPRRARKINPWGDLLG